MSQASVLPASSQSPPCGRFPLGINRKSATPKKSENSGVSTVLGLNGPYSHDLEKRKSEKKRDFRAWLAMRQRNEVIRAGLWDKFKTLCNCGRFAVPEFVKVKGKDDEEESYVPTGSPGCVQISWYGKNEADLPFGYTWLSKCGNPLLCFECAPKVRFVRSQEVQQICSKMYELGYSWQFWTFTASHNLETDPREQVSGFQKALRALKTGKAWTTFKEKWGIKFNIRAVEMTDDSPISSRKSGCHFHYHFIVFFKRNGFFSKSEADEMRNFISKRWVKFLLKFGVITEEKKDDVLKRGFRLDLPRMPKNKDASIEEVGKYIAKGAACEMTPGIFTKNGRIPGRISHWELMALALTRFPHLVPRMLAIMSALKGIHWINYSQGLRDLCKISKKTDEEIMEENLSPGVYLFNDEYWEKIDDFKYRSKLLREIVLQAKFEKIDLDNIPASEKGVFCDDPRIDKLVEIIENYSNIFFDGFDPYTGEDLEELLKNPPQLE